jgi:N-carbamoylputrescine amidase
MIQKHIPFIEAAVNRECRFYAYRKFLVHLISVPGQDAKWYASAETVPGPTTERMAAYAKKYNMVIIVPVYEKEQAWRVVQYRSRD